jgi:hypothetical protein
LTDKLEIKLMPTTAEAGQRFIRALDAQIEELELALIQTKELRTHAARTFGVDRREGGTQMQRLLDASSRALTEVEARAQDALEAELDVERRAAQ